MRVAECVEEKKEEEKIKKMKLKIMKKMKEVGKRVHRGTSSRKELLFNTIEPRRIPQFSSHSFFVLVSIQDITL